jgi:hypothetical protein
VNPVGVLQRRLFELLDDNLDVSVWAGFVPEGAALPYLVVDEGWATPADNHCSIGFDVAVTVHVWSNQRGFRSVNEVAAEVLKTVTNRYVTLPGWGRPRLWCETFEVLSDIEAELRHVPITCRATMIPDALWPPGPGPGPEPLPPIPGGNFTTGHGPPTEVGEPGSLYLDLDSGDIHEWGTA